MLIRKLKKTMVGSLLMLVSTAASAQDLLANHAPVDRKMKNVDSLLLRKFIYNSDVNTLNFAEELYDEWSNELTHYRNSTLLPDEFKIDLRNFTMPTDSKQVTSVYGQRWGRLHAGLDIGVVDEDEHFIGNDVVFINDHMNRFFCDGIALQGFDFPNDVGAGRHVIHMHDAVLTG